MCHRHRVTENKSNIKRKNYINAIKLNAMLFLQTNFNYQIS